MKKKPGVLENIAKSAVSSFNFLKSLSNTSIDMGQPGNAEDQPENSTKPDENSPTSHGAQEQPLSCGQATEQQITESREGSDISSQAEDAEPEKNGNRPLTEKPAEIKKNNIEPASGADTNKEYETLMSPMLEEYTEITRGGHERTDFENDTEFAAEREARIAANKAKLAAMELDMMAIIAANAERAKTRKQEIDEELLKNEANIARLEAERAEMIKRKTEESDARLAELTAGLKKSKAAKALLALERKLLVETQTLELRKQGEYRKIRSRSTEAMEHAKTIAAEHKTAAETRAREIREDRAKRIAAAGKHRKEIQQPLRKSAVAGSFSSRQQNVAIQKNSQSDTRMEQIKKERELQQLRIREVAREKARLEAERRIEIEAERNARLEEIRLKARQEREKREQELKNRKDLS